MNAIGKLPRHQPGRAPDSTRNRAQPSALRLQLDSSEAARRQRNLRNSRTRDFRSSASGMEISVGMEKHTLTRCQAQRCIELYVKRGAGAKTLVAAGASTVICAWG